jgi:hypothetical protein
MRNGTRWVVTVGVALAVVAPAVLPDAADGFPISTYPMFTSDRDRVIDLHTVVLVDGARRDRLSPQMVGGTDEIVLAAVIVGNAIQAGRTELERLCREVAARVDEPGTVEIVTETHDTIELLQEDAPPLRVEVHHRCRADA